MFAFIDVNGEESDPDRLQEMSERIYRLLEELNEALEREDLRRSVKGHVDSQRLECLQSTPPEKATLLAANKAQIQQRQNLLLRSPLAPGIYRYETVQRKQRHVALVSSQHRPISSLPTMSSIQSKRSSSLNEYVLRGID